MLTSKMYYQKKALVCSVQAMQRVDAMCFTCAYFAHFCRLFSCNFMRVLYSTLPSLSDYNRITSVYLYFF